MQVKAFSWSESHGVKLDLATKSHVCVSTTSCWGKTCSRTFTCPMTDGAVGSLVSSFSHPPEIIDPFRDFSVSLVFNSVCMYTFLHILRLCSAAWPLTGYTWCQAHRFQKTSFLSATWPEKLCPDWSATSSRCLLYVKKKKNKRKKM